MKVKIPIYGSLKNELEAYVNEMLFIRHTMTVMIFNNIEFGEETTKKRFGRVVKTIYLTNIDIFHYSCNGEYLGVVNDIDAINDFVSYHNITQCKSDWMKLKKQINGFGFSIMKKKKKNDN